MSSNARCVQLSEELGENIKELQSLEEDQTESRAEIKKVTWLCSWGMGWHWWSELIPVCLSRGSRAGLLCRQDLLEVRSTPGRGRCVTLPL